MSGPRGCPNCNYGKPNGRCALHKKRHNPGSRKRKAAKKLIIEHGFQDRISEKDDLQKAIQLGDEIHRLAEGGSPGPRPVEANDIQGIVDALKSTTTLNIRPKSQGSSKSPIGSDPDENISPTKRDSTESDTSLPVHPADLRPEAPASPGSASDAALPADIKVPPKSPTRPPYYSPSWPSPLSSGESPEVFGVADPDDPDYSDSDFGDDPTDDDHSSDDQSDDSSEEASISHSGEDSSEADKASDFAIPDASGVIGQGVVGEEVVGQEGVAQEGAAQGIVGQEPIGQGTAKDPLNVEDLPAGRSESRQRDLEKREQDLDKSIVRLFKQIGQTSALGVFATSLLDVEEKFRTEAAAKQTSLTETTMLRGILHREVLLKEILALQPSSPLVRGNSSWLNDNLIEVMIELFAERDGLLDGAEHLAPSIAGLVLQYQNTPKKLARLVERLANDKSMLNLFRLKQSTTRVVAALSFPLHWTSFSIDQPSGTVTFIDSLPDVDRREYAAQVLIPFAQLCGEKCGWLATEWKFVSLTPTEQANLDDCGMFASYNAIALLTGKELPSVQGSGQARILAIRMRWEYLEAVRGVLLGLEGENQQLIDVLEGRGVDVPISVMERAQARIKALDKPTRTTPSRDHKPSRDRKPSRDHKKPASQPSRTAVRGQPKGLRHFSRRQKKYVSPNSFLPTRLSGIRDVIFEVLSATENAAGLTVEQMEGPVRRVLEQGWFQVPEHWNLRRLLRVILDRQTHHFEKIREDSDVWVATRKPARRLSTEYLNELRVQRCIPTFNPLDQPALIHINIHRYSGRLGKAGYDKVGPLNDALIQAINATFGSQKHQPETTPYQPGTRQYPMHINCGLPDVQATTSLRDMLAQDAPSTAALEELSEHAQEALQNNPNHRGRFIYRVVIRGLDGGSVNNESWADLQQAYPLLHGQLLVCDDRSLPNIDAPIVQSKPMMDWATPGCLLPQAQSRAKSHRHVIWGMFEMRMLAYLWSTDVEPEFPRLRGTLESKLMHDEEFQQLLACSKLLLSNSLLYYHLSLIHI